MFVSRQPTRDKIYRLLKFEKFRKNLQRLNLVIEWNNDSWDNAMYLPWCVTLLRSISKYILCTVATDCASEDLVCRVFKHFRDTTVDRFEAEKPDFSRRGARVAFFHFAYASESSFQRQLPVLLHKREKLAPEERFNIAPASCRTNIPRRVCLYRERERERERESVERKLAYLPRYNFGK